MYAKQFLPLTSNFTMLQQTVRRLEGIPKLADSAIVVCNEDHRFLVAQQLLEVSTRPQILLEPEGRNTAPAIALAALHALERAPNGPHPMLMVMPADHVIAEEAGFRVAVVTAAEAAARGSLVTFGIVPRHAHTGYGYIEADAQPGAIMPVAAFTEKPDTATAETFVATGRHFWNSGMFLFRADAYIEELGQHAPDMLDA